MSRILTPLRTIGSAVGPLNGYCVSSRDLDTDGTGPVAVLKLSTALASQDTDPSLEEVVSLGRAESSDAYVGQINAITTSSISWINGPIWGYDIARHDDLIDSTLKTLMKCQRGDGVWIPVYSAAPLLEASKALFGTSEARRFPLVPGSHVLCASKEVVAQGPVQVWSALALAIPEDRGGNACLVIEDAGEGCGSEPRQEQEGVPHQFRRVNDLVESVIKCGDDQGVALKEVFVAYKSEWVPSGRVGCALSRVHFLALARNAVPSSSEEILAMSLSEWEAFASPGFPQQSVGK